MKTYLLSAAGVIFLSVIVSLIIPEGKLNKTITFVMRMACIIVLIQPITGIFKIDDAVVNEPLFDYEYISGIYTENQSEQLEKLLSEKFNEECDCLVEVKYEEGNFKVTNVTVEILDEEEKIIDDIYAYLKELGYINITVYAKSY